jgi:hypothetical protein
MLDAASGQVLRTIAVDAYPWTMATAAHASRMDNTLHQEAGL